MLVYVENSPYLAGIARRIERQGDEVTNDPEAETLVKIKAPAIVERDEVDAEKIEGSQKFGLATFYDGEGYVGGLHLIIPLEGLANDNLSAKVVCGSVINPVDTPKLLESQITDALGDLRHMCQSTGYKGFVFIQFADTTLTHIGFGLPWWSQYAIFEQIGKTKISTWMQSGGQLLPSWAVASVVSLWPWPEQNRSVKIRGIENIDNELEKHFWACGSVNKGIMQTAGGVLGVATSWHAVHLHAACSYAQYTCAKVEIEGVQYRTDLNHAFSGAWLGLHDMFEEFRFLKTSLVHPYIHR